MIDVEMQQRKIPAPEIVWEGKEGNILYRLIVKHYVSGNAPKAILEKCVKMDNMDQPIWLESEVKIPDSILISLAKLSSNDDNILEPRSK